MATATELVTEFSYKGSEKPLHKYNDRLNSSIILITSVTTAMIAAVVATGRWAASILPAERNLYNLSYETGIAIEKIQELSYSAELMGSTSQAMQASIRSLSATIGNAAQKGSEDFARLGIAVRDANGRVRQADEVLDDVRLRFKQLNLSMSEQRSFASALGIDASLLRMLHQTDDQMAGMMTRARELGTLNEKQAEQAEQYSKSLIAQRFAMDGLRRLIAVGFAPELTRLTDGFVGLIERNREWIIDGVRNAMSILNDFGEMLKRIWPVLAIGAASFLVLSGAMGLLLSPAVLITAGILALLFIIDDLIVAFKGGKSVIREFFLEFFNFDIQPVLQKIVDGFLIMVEEIKKLFKAIWNFIKGMFSGFGKLIAGDLKGGFGDILQAYKDLWGDVVDSFFAIFGEALRWMKDQITGLLPNWALKLLGKESKTTNESLPGDIAYARPGGSQIQNNRSSNVNQNVQINVKTNDPERAARLTSDNLQRQMNDAQTQANRGGM